MRQVLVVVVFLVAATGAAFAGDSEKAREHYRVFVEWWKDSDPELRPMLEEGRAALARLSPDARES